MTSPAQVPVATLAGGGMPEVGFGTWRLRGDQARAAVREALAVGYRHIDTATMYGGQPDRLGAGRYDASVLAGHAERGIAVEGYSGIKHTSLDDPVLAKIAAAHGVTTAHVVLRWHLEHDITVIPKSARPDRIAANFDLFGFPLTPEEVAGIDALAGRRGLARRTAGSTARRWRRRPRGARPQQR
ncbi:MAG: aldo/keto reductase [Streptosporangiaceae bacterium]